MPQASDHSHRVQTVGESGLQKTKALLNLISLWPNVDKVYLFNKDSCHAKYQWSIDVRKEKCLNRLKSQNHFLTALKKLKRKKIKMLYIKDVIC